MGRVHTQGARPIAVGGGKRYDASVVVGRWRVVGGSTSLIPRVYLEREVHTLRASVFSTVQHCRTIERRFRLPRNRNAAHWPVKEGSP